MTALARPALPRIALPRLAPRGSRPSPLSPRVTRALGRATVVALLAVLALQGADAATTVAILGRGGYEANPVAAGLFARGLTPWELWPAVAVVAAGMAGLAWRARRACPALLRVLPVGLGLWVAVKVWVVAGNLAVLAHR